nr:ABC transporter F family member 4-like [Tanacetum cinerariifolium]
MLMEGLSHLSVEIQMGLGSSGSCLKPSPVVKYFIFESIDGDETISLAPVVSANEELIKLKQEVASLLEVPKGENINEVADDARKELADLYAKLQIIQTLSQKLTMLYKGFGIHVVEFTNIPKRVVSKLPWQNLYDSCSKYGLSPADAQTGVCTRNTNANGVQMSALCAVTMRI